MSRTPTPYKPPCQPTSPIIFIKAPGRSDQLDWNKDLDAHLDIRAATQNIQPSPINVRQVWPKDGDVKLSEDPSVPFSEAEFRSEFGGNGISPTGRYCQKTTIEGRTWTQHAWEVRCALVHLHRARMLNNFSLQAMLVVLGQGIEHSTYMMQDFISIKTRSGLSWRNGKDPARCDRRLEETSEMVDVDLPSKTTTFKIRRALYRRRLIGTMIHFDAATHWVAAVFDRATGHLYVLDTLESNRKERAKLALLAWRQFGANLGFYSTICAIVPPIAEQPNGWCCGFLGLVLLQQCLRGLIGQSVQELVQSNGIDRIGADSVSYSNMPSLASAALLVPDWTFGGSTTIDGVRRASVLLKAIMCNEIGIQGTGHLNSMLPQSGNQPTFALYKGFPGQCMQIKIQGDESWPRGPRRLLTRIYEPGGVIYQQGLGLSGQTQPPESFPSLDLSAARHYERTGYHSRDEIMRCGSIRCWNTSSALYRAPEGASTDAQMDAMTISSG